MRSLTTSRDGFSRGASEQLSRLDEIDALTRGGHARPTLVPYRQSKNLLGAAGRPK